MSRTEAVPPVHLNLVVLQGALSSPPRHRELPSGATLVQLEVTTRLADASVSVPVVLTAPDAAVEALDTGAHVVVVGRVARRFFRAGAVTQSRTEVVATSVVPASRRRAIDRALERALHDARGLLDAARVGVG